MLFRENRPLEDVSREISYLFFRKIRKMLQNLSSAAVVIDTLRVKSSIMQDVSLEIRFTAVITLCILCSFQQNVPAAAVFLI